MSTIADGFNQLLTYRKKINFGFLKKIFGVTFLLLVAYLLISKGMELDWNKIWHTMLQTEKQTLAIAFILSFACYTAYASYDLIGRHQLHLPIKPRQSMLVAWVSYAFNLNLGALIGSVGLRYRLYSHYEINATAVTKILSISVFSNWMGYLMLSGLLFVSGTFSPPADWSISTLGIQLVGSVFLGIPLFYIGLCAFSKQREFTFKDRSVILPRLPIVAWQFGTAFVHWTLMVAVMYQFFANDLEFSTLYLVLLVSCIAGAVSHIPGGLGVIEGVFLALLSDKLDRHQIISGILAYRSVFYLAPLLIALPIYLYFEVFSKRIKNK